MENPIGSVGEETRPATHRAPNRHNNLPHASNPFVGRRREYAEVSALLATSRLVTLVGPAGAGKSRLALRVAARAEPRFPAGVWLVPVASLSDPADLPSFAASILPLPDGSAPVRSAEQLSRSIGDCEMLIVLDDCDHVVDDCAHLADVLLHACPALGILATSREALAIDGEQIAALGPLSLPDAGHVDAATLAASEAGELFLRRAVATSPGFTLRDSTAPTVAQICREVDALPLAVELAAARVASLSVAEILERLANPFGLLKNGRRTAEPRHRSLAAAFEWSDPLLSPPQALVLRRLAVFEGWTIEAAEYVSAGGDVDPSNLVDLLDALVKKSLVVAEPGKERVRYHLLKTVRAWARMKLEASPEAADIRRRHALWYSRVAEAAEDDRRRGMVTASRHKLDAEFDNLAAALSWARSCRDPAIGVRLATALTPLWRARGQSVEAVAWLDWALVAAGALSAEDNDAPASTHGPPDGDRSRSGHVRNAHHDGSRCDCNPMTRMFENPRQALLDIEERMGFCRRTADMKGLSLLFVTAGQAHFFLGEPRLSRMNFEECVRLGRERADDESLRAGLSGLARVALLVGDLAAVEGSANEVLTLARAEGNEAEVGGALAFLGDVARVRGEWDASRQLLTSADEMLKAANVPLAIARTQYLLARLDEAEGRSGPDRLVAQYEDALRLGRAARGPGYHEFRCLIGIGTARHAAGDTVAAAGYLLEALARAGDLGDLHASALALEGLAQLAAEQGDADEASMLAQRGLALHQQVGAVPGIVTALELLAAMAVDTRRHAFATRLLGATQAVRAARSYARGRPMQARHERDVDALRASLGEKVFADAWGEGAALPLDSAVTYAQRGRGSRVRAQVGWESLTPAERDVARLVGEGLTNPQVGQRLFISPRTVGHHLTHVFDKLGIRSRHALIRQLAEQDS